MARSRFATLVLVGALASMGAGYQVRTPNFVVTAATPQIAREVADYAEHYRKEKAVQWLGREMPAWRSPCPLEVTVTMDGAGGATTFEYANGEVLSQRMHIEGKYERLLASVLPHEITHTVFAHYYRCPVPRWADEGGSVLSEDDAERNRHEQLTRQILSTPGRTIPLRRLFALKEYPSDVMALYAEGYSVTNFLVAARGRGTFLNFLAQGMRQGWDQAAQTVYGYRGVEDLERAWIEEVRTARKGPAATHLAANATGRRTEGTTASRVVVRQTAPPVLLTFEEPQPIVRAASGERGRVSAPSSVVLGAPEAAPPSARLGDPVSR